MLADIDDRGMPQPTRSTGQAIKADPAFAGRTLVITGGTGTFGHAVVKRMLGVGFSEIRVFSRDELKQDDMRREFACPILSFYIGDVRDPASLDSVMHGADFVFHAAALKQVPSCEFFPLEAIRTNSIGTENVLTSAIAHGVSRVVLLSTDKAAYPINAMGMTKAMAEKLALAKAQQAADSGTVISVTRYGNVMASRGSVIPLFFRQVAAGEPLTVTNPAMTRFLMSVDEAVDLVSFAFAHAEPGDLFVRKAPSATIADLAESVQMVAERWVGTRCIGVRHGEKLYETLLTSEEMVRAEDMDTYFRVRLDGRGLNYNSYFVEGEPKIAQLEDYHSHNAARLGPEEVCALLRRLPQLPAMLATR